MSFSISGIASGLDTDSMVKQLMDIERIPVTRLQNKIVELTNQKTVWSEINTKLNALRSASFDLKLDTSFGAKKVTSSDESIVTATGSAVAPLGTYNLKIETLASAHSIVSTKDMTFSDSSGSLIINGTTVTVDKANSLADFRDAINKTENIGVNASILDNKLVLTSKEMGQGSQITLSDILGSPTNFVSELGLDNPVQLMPAQDAKFSVNNLSITRSSNTIKDVIDGVTLNLKKETANNVTLKIESDTEKITEKITTFIEKYNDVLDYIKTKTAATGELANNSTLLGIKQKLVQTVAKNISGGTAPYNTLMSIGISTTDLTQTLKFDPDSKLHIDADKLNTALIANPDAIKSLFFNVSKNGVGDGLDTQIGNWVTFGTGTVDIHKKSIDNMTKVNNDKLLKLQDSLVIKEKNLKSQFSAMETALQQMQSQGNRLTSQLASLPSSN